MRKEQYISIIALILSAIFLSGFQPPHPGYESRLFYYLFDSSKGGFGGMTPSIFLPNMVFEESKEGIIIDSLFNNETVGGLSYFVYPYFINSQDGYTLDFKMKLHETETSVLADGSPALVINGWNDEPESIFFVWKNDGLLVLNSDKGVVSEIDFDPFSDIEYLIRVKESKKSDYRLYINSSLVYSGKLNNQVPFMENGVHPFADLGTIFLGDMTKNGRGKFELFDAKLYINRDRNYFPVVTK